MVTAWQRALYADGWLANCGSSGIDGIFGSNTERAKKSWQSHNYITSDGKVGPITWSTADDNLAREPAGTTSSVIYVGSARTMYYTLPTTGGYSGTGRPARPWLTGHPGHYSYPYC